MAAVVPMAAVVEVFLGAGEWIVGGLLEAIRVVTAALPEALGGPFAYGFMRRALLTSMLVGTLAGVLSCFVVLKRWALLGDAISHAVLPGVAVAYALNVPFGVGAFASGALSSLAIGAVERSTKIKEDAAIGIVFTGAFAAGVVVISRMATSTHLMHILFGNVLGVRMGALVATLYAAVVAAIVLLLSFHTLVLYVFDPVQASAVGINTRRVHYGLMLLLTLVIVTSLETVGIILVVAMLITPGATAQLITDRLGLMMVIAGGVGLGSSVLGLYLSFVLNVASGGTIVLVTTGCFLVALCFGRFGVRARWARAGA